MHFIKSIVRKGKKLFSENAPIEHLSYAKNERENAVKKENSLRWFDNFIGFKQFKPDEDHLFFAYYSNDGSGNLYVPIYVGYNPDSIEYDEGCEENPYIVMMYGSDNASYFIRLKSEEEVNECLCFISECESYSEIKDSYFLNFYNS